jgi:hypothetical protein
MSVKQWTYEKNAQPVVLLELSPQVTFDQSDPWFLQRAYQLTSTL